ncbi:oxidoreductase [Mycolicibacterium diernhoferi]|uniref:Oxidoreductase n=1 Tax=Mycolicibacterium diernhoferi TaxID=1801 RepID=A0A1Q4HEP3_9MYCO|nr:oxidoreductase [Mycolicibacterium diernhoferi]OJZ66014.1 oxidoreductase [Mycolicibacterium diernhoferi]OPE55019.1 oxidoreductase [Mycolicibacterium diernhoferi]PEG54625.1 oxidoreductase [Mycolicibacterium diernhoferi]QYL23919.1 oxidoreductase [Mycolicibacterium diernhoferi]
MHTPSLAVWKFASCDGCQLTLLDCEDQLLTLADEVRIVTFLEASSVVVAGPYDISLVEGSISTEADRLRILEIRRQSTILVTIGACATAGGIQALRNMADADEFASVVYARPDYIHTLATSTPAAAHVEVDYQLQGCPIDRGQLLDTLAALLIGRKPRLPAKTVCSECKLRGVTCVLVAESIPCLGPVTQAGCGALCPSCHRGCYGCFGPAATPDTAALIPLLRRDGLSEDGVEQVFSTFNVTRFAAERNDR